MDRLKEEKEYLEKVKERIKEERENHKITLQRIPWEYKNRYADVKWGDEGLVKDLMQIYLKRLKTIENLENNPYFGRFDFAESTKNDQNKYYIGKTNIEGGTGFLVLDWRNPICTLYYDQSIGPVSYIAPDGIIEGNLTRKSQILIKDGEIQDVREVDLVSDDELLQPYLSVNADSRMKTIIASLHTLQNSIIRKPINLDIMVQGSAGSGKSSIALHRVPYLLYTFGDQYDTSSFAIIGPNKYFLNYISSILPDLDTQSVEEYTFEEIAAEIIGEENYIYESSNDEMSRFLSSKKRCENSKRIKGTLEYKQALIRFVNDYFNQCFNSGVNFENINIISNESLKQGISFKKGYADSINDFIKATVKRIKEDSEELYYDLSQPLMLEMKQYPLESKERNDVISRMDALKAILKKGCANELRKLVKPLLISPINLYIMFLANIDKYINLNTEDLKYFQKETVGMLKKKIISYEDMPALSYLSLMYKNEKEYEKYKHIVIDEAQDYNLFQFDLLKLLFKNSTFSIFGDLAQAIYSYRSINSWEEVNNQIFDGKFEIINMNKSYRNTREITNISNSILKQLKLQETEPVIRVGEEVKFTPIITAEKEMYYLTKIYDFLNKGYKSVGIICKTLKEMDYVATILQNLHIPFNYIRSSDKEYKAGVSILTSYLAKGLEFDAAIINDASETIYDSNSETDMHLLYVAITRALHELDIMYSGDLVLPLKSNALLTNMEASKVLIKKKKNY